MLYSLICVIIIYSLITPALIIKAYEKGTKEKIIPRPKPKAVRKAERQNKAEAERINKILDNINNYDGSKAGQEGI